MKRIIFISLLLSLYACKDKGKEQTPKYTQQPHQHWIPNWEKDTLVAINGTAAPYLTDIMYSETIGDTSVLYYQGEKYYVWTENVKIEPEKTSYYFRPDMQEYNNIVVSKIPFSNVISDFFTEGFFVQPATYFSSLNNAWVDQFQAIAPKRRPDIPGWSANALYSTEYKQYLD